MKITKTLDIFKSDGWIVASTPALDRDRDRIMPMGGDLSNYQRNPVVIFGHNYHEPWAVIGRADDLVADSTSLRFKPELRTPASEADPMHIVRALWDQNLLRAASIGFMPIESRENEFGGRDFTKWELLEISLVPVPANQEAIRMAVKALTTTPASPPHTEPNTDDTAAASNDNDTELTPAQEAALAGALAQLTQNLTSVLIGD